MNSFDAILVVALALAAWGGHRLGLVKGMLSWAGLVLGLTVGVLFVDNVTNLFKSASPQVRFVAALTFLLFMAVLGQTLGMTAASVAARFLPTAGPLRALDELAGAAAAVVAVLAVLWLLTPALASSPGWTARAVRGSWIAREVQRVAPDPPAEARTLGRLVGEAPFPEVFRRLTKGDAGVPPVGDFDPAVSARVSPGVVRVEGQACGLVVDGSGFVAAPGLVVTNAHVVAGERQTDVYSEDGRRRGATVVAFDPNRDLALLRVDAAGLPTLELADAGLDSAGAVFGHPGGGPLKVSPARIERVVDARGSDIYRTSPTRRDVLVLAAELEPGDSGAPLVDTAGRVVGVAFAIDPGSSTTAYALNRPEIDAVLGPARNATAAVDTGPCLVG